MGLGTILFAFALGIAFTVSAAVFVSVCFWHWITGK